MVNPTILRESEAQFGPFFSRRDPGRKDESWASVQTRYLGGTNGRVYKVE